MTFPEALPIEQIRMYLGRGHGARFMKKNSPLAPLGYLFITMARC